MRHGLLATYRAVSEEAIRVPETTLELSTNIGNGVCREEILACSAPRTGKHYNRNRVTRVGIGD